MAAPVLTFFNNKGGVGKTPLVYHLAWMLSEMDRSVLAVDLDPQANLTAAFLSEGVVEAHGGRPAPRVAARRADPAKGQRRAAPAGTAMVSRRAAPTPTKRMGVPHTSSSLAR
ncbi:ParA family protein [Candidatus Palauibacter sp.]|uniref:ParA family protein n=1 Tax=Candidatus Palauibacter sp. TaxID=3101350 RepID=UPI003AF27DA7